MGEFLMGALKIIGACCGAAIALVTTWALCMALVGLIRSMDEL